MPSSDRGFDLDEPVQLPPLVYFADGDEVTIGRRDTDSYGIFPADGAEVVRRLAAGSTPRQIARWYAQEFGESLDIDHVLAALAELELLQPAGEPPADRPAPPRWQRLGAALFAGPAWLVYGAVVLWAAVAMARSPDLVPTYHHIFFTDYYTLIELGLFVGTVPLLLLHEAFHALAGRRLGLHSRMRISHRLYFVVLETSLDGLVAVPRRKRVLPILAGMVVDLLAFAVLTLIADLTRRPDGGFSWFGGWFLAIAFMLLLRIVWQFFFYLRTDLYTLITALLGCVDLHTTARQLLAHRIRRVAGQVVGRLARLAGRPDRLTGRPDRRLARWATPAAVPPQWHPVDRRAAGWYSWLIGLGYTISIGTLLLVVLPVLYRMLTGAASRLTGSGAAWDGLLDSVVFIGFTLAQVLLTIWLAARERRQRKKSQLQHVIT
jgi:hypothetical protein